MSLALSEQTIARLRLLGYHDVANKYDPKLIRLVEESRGLAFGVATKFFSSPDDAEDAVQEASVKLLTKGNVEATNWYAFVVSVTRRVCLDILRMRRRRVSTVSFEEFAPDTVNDVHIIDVIQAQSPDLDNLLTLERQLSQLCHEDQALLTLLAQGYTYADIARMQGLAPSNIWWKAFYARERLSFFADRENTGALVNREEC